MVKRNKRLKKQIVGLEKQTDKHRNKVLHESVQKDTTRDYWEGEIERFEVQRAEREKILRGLKRKKKDNS